MLKAGTIEFGGATTAPFEHLGDRGGADVVTPLFIP
jgi:hypothetical protein